MNNIQTNLGDLKHQLKQIQIVNLAQIDRIQNLLEKISNPNFDKLSYQDQYDLKTSLSDAGKFMRNYMKDKTLKLDDIMHHIFHYCLFNSYAESELNKKVKIEKYKNKSAKDMPFDIFKLIMNDENTPQLVKNELIRQRGDKRYKIKGLQ